MALEIYYVNIKELSGGELFEKGLSLVNGERQKKVSACKNPDDRCRSLAAGLLIRYACMERGLDYDALQFFRSDSGKPSVDGMHFNVSHSGDYAAIAAGTSPVGIDVERLTDRFHGKKGQDRLRGIVKKTFDAEETQEFEQRFAGELLSEQALLFAATVWTRKESYAKECGKGLSMDFSGIHTLCTDGFSSWELPGGYTLSVYTRSGEDVRIPVCVPLERLVYYEHLARSFTSLV
jgi:4'-phosphopantetheinyl transferase